eukprot:9543233-Alexandrium_andersonii.AAC.1
MVTWNARGFGWEADPSHIEHIIAEMEAEGATPSSTPCCKQTGRDDPYVLDPLGKEDAWKFRSLAAT